MLFDSALRKDLSRSFVATLVVLLTSVITLMLIRTLGQAAKGSFNPQDIMTVMAYTVLGYMPIVLSLSLFVAIIGTLSRMYQDSEMVIWFSGGKSIVSMLPTLLRFAAPVIVGVTVLSLFVWPWSQKQILELRYQFEQRSDLDRIAPGEFQVSSNGESVFFVDRESSNLESAKQIFLATRTPQSNAITTAQQASIEYRQAQTWAVLNNGQRVEHLKGENPTTRISDFAMYEAVVQNNAVGMAETTVRATPTMELLDGTDNSVFMSELVWRLGLIFSAINYVVVALALTSANPRSSRMGHTLTALLVFIAYFNFLSLAQSWVARGKVEAVPMLLALHGSVLLVAVLWLWMRNAQFSLKAWLFRRASA